MVGIGRTPRKTQGFFKPLQQHFARPAWRHFCGLVMAITIGHCSTIERLAKLLRGLLRGSTHRTNHGEFLWRSDWSESRRKKSLSLRRKFFLTWLSKPIKIISHKVIGTVPIFTMKEPAKLGERRERNEDETKHDDCWNCCNVFLH